MKTSIRKYVLGAVFSLALVPLLAFSAYKGYANLDATTGAVPVTQGGTGAVTSAAALDSLGAVGVLAVIQNVNLKNAGQTFLYLAPSGHSAVITDIKIVADTATAVTIVPSVRVGKASAYNEWCGITALTGLTTSGQFVSLNALASVQAREAFLFIDQVKIDVTTGATATTLTGDIYVEGYLI